LALQNLPPLSLADGEYAIDNGTANDRFIDFAKPQLTEQNLTVGGQTLRLAPGKVFANALEVTGHPTFDLVAVVPDRLLDGAPVKRDLLSIQYRGDKAAAEKLAFEKLPAAGGSGELNNRLSSLNSVVEESSSATTSIAYLAVYLGVVFLIASATVLAITQLSESNDNARRYKLLRQLGASDRMINRAVFLQILIYFGAPLALAVVHAVVAILTFSQLVSSFSGSSIAGSSLATALIIVVIYGGYFTATYISSRNLIRREYQHHERDN
jgi:putative ABC transport system permease protein